MVWRVVCGAEDPVIVGAGFALIDCSATADGVDVAPDLSVVGCDFEHDIGSADIDERVAVGEAICAGHDISVEAGAWGGGVGPGGYEWGVGAVGVDGVGAVWLGWRGEFDDGAPVTFAEGVGAAVAVIEHEDITGAGQVWSDPMWGVLPEQDLLFCCACLGGGGVTPAIEEVAAFAGAAACVTGGFSGGGAVVDDPDFPEAGHT